MMGIGFPELMIILIIIMIIFGAGKLPEIGSAFGNSIRNFKKSMKEAEENTEEVAADEAAKELPCRPGLQIDHDNFHIVQHKPGLWLQDHHALF